MSQLKGIDAVVRRRNVLKAKALGAHTANVELPQSKYHETRVSVSYSVRERLWTVEDCPRVFIPQHVIGRPLSLHPTDSRPGESFRFDLASIPRAAWWAIAPFELSVLAPLIHDYLYNLGTTNISADWTLIHGPREARGWGVTRKEADLIFMFLMEQEGVPAWRRNVAYNAVRWFGPRW